MNGKEEKKRGIDPENIPEAQLPGGKNYLCVIGIDHYQDKAIPVLRNAENDARAVKKILLEKYQFEASNTFTLFNGEATQAAIIGRLKSLAGTLTEEDTLLTYFAGHGEYDEQIDVGYWMPFDARFGQIGSYISFDLITRLVRAIKSRHTFIIADSCYSGSFFTTRRATVAENRLESLPSRWLLTAGRKEVVSDGFDGGHSPFAEEVIWQLNNNQEPRLRVSQFCNEIVVAVGNNADQLPRGAALQDVGDKGGEFMFRLKAFKDKAFEPTPAAGSQREPAPVRTGKPNPPRPQPEPQAPAPLRTLQDVRERLKEFLKKDDFDGVFNLFDRIIDDRSRRENDIIMQQSQYNSILRQQRSGLVDNNFVNMTLNRIRYALTSIADELEAGDLKPGALQPEMPAGGTGGAYLDELERKGLEEQAATLQRKLNHFKLELAKAYDSGQKFTLQEQINETERQLKEIREKLG